MSYWAFYVSSYLCYALNDFFNSACERDKTGIPSYGSGMKRRFGLATIASANVATHNLWLSKRDILAYGDFIARQGLQFMYMSGTSQNPRQASRRRACRRSIPCFQFSRLALTVERYHHQHQRGERENAFATVCQ